MPLSTSPRLLAATAALAVSLTALAGCSAGEDDTPDAATPLRVALAWIPNVEYGGFWLADSAGYYEDEGLDIEWIPGGPEAPTVEATVAAGGADVGVESSLGQLLQAVSQGDELVALGSVFQENPACILTLGPDPVTSIADLQGKRILSQDESVVATLFDVAGLPHDYTYVPTSFDPGALVSGDGDAYTAYFVNQPVTLETQFGLEEGKDFTCALLSDLGLPTYASTIFTATSSLSEDRDTYVRFLRATLKGWTDYLENTDEAAQLAVDVYGVSLGLDLEQQKIQAERQLTLLESDGTAASGLLSMDEDLVQGTIYDVLAAQGLTDLPPASDVIDGTVLEDAAK